METKKNKSLPWSVCATNFDHADFRIEERLSAQEFLRQLCESKAMAGRLLAQEKLCFLVSPDYAALAASNETTVKSTDVLNVGDVLRLKLDVGCKSDQGAACDVAQDDVSQDDVAQDDVAQDKICGSVLAPEQILWRDRFVVAVNKVPGILVHGDGTSSDNLSTQLQRYLDLEVAKQNQASSLHAQAVQRLDVPTSGVVFFSICAETQPAFDALVASREMHKEYLAVVEGLWPQNLTKIDWAIGRDRHDAQKMRVAAGAKPALTEVRCLARRHGKSLLLVSLKTGRRHQIRVHLAHAGFPLVGDELYGRRSGGSRTDGSPSERRRSDGRRTDGLYSCGIKNLGYTQLCLHAWRESFVHPISGEYVSVCAPWPQRFNDYFCENDTRGV